MKPGVRQIADGLYQAALAHASLWNCVAEHVDVAVLMASAAEPMPEGVEHIYFPINDDANGTEHFEDVRKLAQQLAPRRVLTICHMGENRSGLLSALILVARGMSNEAAIALVQQNGSHNSPSQAHSLWNPGFVRQIRENAAAR